MPLSYVANNRIRPGAGGGVGAPTPPPPDLPSRELHDELFVRRRALLADVARLAREEVGAATRAARELNLPVEPGTAAARQTLVAWAHLLEGLLGTDHTGPS